jgi:TolA-binding protein
MRNRVIWAAMLAVVWFAAPRPAHAVSKEIIALQTQVQQLLDDVQRLQSTVDTKFGVLQNLTQQTADQVNQMTAAVNTLQQKLGQQNDASGGKLDTVSGQVQSLNDSVDELKSRLVKLDKTLQELQTQLQSAQPGAAMQSSSGGASPAGGSSQGGQQQGSAGQGGGQAPPLQDTFQAGVRDFNAARYALAEGEFQDVVHYYPLDDLAGSAQFYLGEIAYQQQKFQEAINNYNAVLEGFSGSKQAPTAQLHKGLALLAMNKRDAGIRELRQLIQRRPQTPEAQRARTKLNGLGVRIK